MADLKINPATPSIYALEETILFLRPTTEEAILGVEATENDFCRFEVAPQEEPTDPLVDEVVPESHKTHDHPFALRLGFDTIKNPSRDGFTVGGSGCDINFARLRAKCYFVIHYAMQSGALMVSARVPISIGGTDLECMQSLLLMNLSKIRCETVDLVVEFPDIRDCAQSHKANYQRYFARLGYKEVPYLPTSLAKSLSVGLVKSVGKLGQGGFGIVYKVVHKSKGTLFAMKLLNGKPSDYKEVEVLKNLHHSEVSNLIKILSIMHPDAIT